MKEFVDNGHQIVLKFKEKRNYECYINSLPENLLEIDCSKCHKLCPHILELAEHYMVHSLSRTFFDTLWLYEKIKPKTFFKARNTLSRTYLTNVTQESLEATVDGNNETYSVVFEDGKRHCSCIYGKIGNNLCYHQVATILSAINTKSLNISTAKRLIE